MSSNNGNVPASLADVDNQKKAETCSLFALSKAVSYGFETDKFLPGHLDFDQGQTKTALLGLVNDAGCRISKAITSQQHYSLNQSRQMPLKRTGEKKQICCQNSR